MMKLESDIIEKIYTYLLNFFFISLFQACDITSSFLGFFNLLPSFHLFLFQKSNTVCQKLGITIDTKKLEKWCKMKKCDIDYLLLSSLFHLSQTFLLVQVVLVLTNHFLLGWLLTTILHLFLTAFHFVITLSFE